jgi:hypothetical protein
LSVPGSGRPALALLVALLACGGDAPLQGPRELPMGIPDAGSLLRLPAEGGEALLYRSDSLTPLDWRLRGAMPPILRALGTDLDDRMVYAVDRDGEVIGLDLVARRQRPYLADVRRITGTPDGAVLALDSTGRPIGFRGRTRTTFAGPALRGNDIQLVRSPGLSPGLAAYSAASHRLTVHREEAGGREFTVPAGELASSWFGDVQVVTTDSGIVVVLPDRDRAPQFLKLRGMPITSAFSPSAHQLYVARARGDVLILNRFGWDELGTLPLPGTARALRADRSGRWLLAQPAQGDSIWVLDMVRRERTITIRAPWAEDLPLVSGGRTLIVRDGADVVAWDLLAAPPAPRGRLADASADRYLQLPWSPEDGAAGFQAPEPPPIADDVAGETPPAGAVDSLEADAPSEPGAERIYIQVSSSQNVAYARALATQLGEIGFRARVLDPRADGDGYRVVVGPYGSREEAEADGRRLGRPYFVTNPESGPP